MLTCTMIGHFCSWDGVRWQLMILSWGWHNTMIRLTYDSCMWPRCFVSLLYCTPFHLLCCTLTTNIIFASSSSFTISDQLNSKCKLANIEEHAPACNIFKELAEGYNFTTNWVTYKYRDYALGEDRLNWLIYPLQSLICMRSTMR